MSSDAQTKGFRLTHVGLRVADIDQSGSFYSGVFGIMDLGRMLDIITVVFLGNSDASSPNFSDYPDTDFVKMAIGVPYMTKATQYIKSHQVRVMKEAGSTPSLEVVATFLGCETPEKCFGSSLWQAAADIPFVEDQDGYLTEIIPY
ncbi:hypothetical protein N7447_003230 [Penicillium robsamsonii]|uniref:uncharacterized protein n=1 Tax=Penicillium robsamsonii TaxID=1792511 RepID=UPI002547645A|nr:uncharacterized protein N7447_003230 [Penicillium robsamsonii]KAJ5826467.1 hypothetical protein N7447_003230 [Penicillium robsamsonii]